MRRDWWREPLLHFLAFGLMVSAATRVLVPPEDEDARRIAVTESVIADLNRQLQDALGRQPTEAETTDAVERWINDEILVREAKALGLDRQDPVIRSRLAQKMGQLEAEVHITAPATEAELRALYDADRERFQTETRVTLRQVFFDPSTPETIVTSALKDLNQGIDPKALTEQTAKPPGGPTLRRRTPTKLSQQLGETFMQATLNAPLETWVHAESNRGVHLVQVLERTEGRRLTLQEAEARLRQLHRRQRVQEATRQTLKRLRAEYTLEGWEP